MFAKVPRFWYALETTAKQTVLSGKPHQCGKLRWLIDGEFLRLLLPSGRTLAYHRPTVSVDGKLSFMAVNSITKKYDVEHTFGGRLAENATQAVARDIMVAAMFRLIKTKNDILFTVHDEMVTEAPIGTQTPEHVVKIVRQVPEWAKGCPINAECEKTERYKK
jgi:DNA polymerase